MCHGQKITQQPREVLKSIPGLELVELPESTWCCGSAGIYNITQPEMAGALATRKLSHIATTGADFAISANAGCTLHLTGSAKSAGKPLRILHPVEVLHLAVFGPDT